jgi:hypothetical protein
MPSELEILDVLRRAIENGGQINAKTVGARGFRLFCLVDGADFLQKNETGFSEAWGAGHEAAPREQTDKKTIAAGK